MSRRRFILSAIFLSLSFLLPGDRLFATAEENNIIPKGVFIDEVDVSGMTRGEAEAAIDDFVESLQSRGIAILVGEGMVTTTLGDLGYTVQENDNIDNALSLGKSGNLIKRYKDLKDIEQGNIVYPLSFTLNESKLRDIIVTQVSTYNIEPVNATIARKNKEFVYTDHIVGKKVDIEETTGIITNSILNNWNRKDIVVEAAMEDDMPIFTREVVERCNTLLGTFTTEYADSAEGRAANLANGARLINNAVIYPGEVFSSYKYLTPFTVENGYYVAGAYLQGRVIDSVGGGACQVTTTLYNAVLNAELEIVERQPHSMTISYVDLARDAAIAGTYKDFKFKNNTDVPIVIEAYTKGRRITFNIWGEETRDTKNRRVEYVTVVLSETPPPADVITEDPTQPTTYRKVTQSAHTGYKSELYKVVYENDVEVSRTLINKSNYAAAPRYVTVGTKVVEEEPEKPDDSEEANNPEDNDPSEDQEPKEDEDQDQEEEQEPEQNQVDESEANEEVESQSVIPENKTNPNGHLQSDIYWDSTWDMEDPE